jgi:hypothetical protein
MASKRVTGECGSTDAVDPTATVARSVVTRIGATGVLVGVGVGIGVDVGAGVAVGSGLGAGSGLGGGGGTIAPVGTLGRATTRTANARDRATTRRDRTTLTRSRTVVPAGLAVGQRRVIWRPLTVARATVLHRDVRSSSWAVPRNPRGTRTVTRQPSPVATAAGACTVRRLIAAAEGCATRANAMSATAHARTREGIVRDFRSPREDANLPD